MLNFDKTGILRYSFSNRDPWHFRIDVHNVSLRSPPLPNNTAAMSTILRTIRNIRRVGLKVSTFYRLSVSQNAK